jgi:hypothetical protein
MHFNFSQSQSAMIRPQVFSFLMLRDPRIRPRAKAQNILLCNFHSYSTRYGPVLLVSQQIISCRMMITGRLVGNARTPGYKGYTERPHFFGNAGQQTLE